MRLLLDGVAFANRRQLGVQRIFLETLPRLAGRVAAEMFVSEPPQTPLPRRVRAVGYELHTLAPAAWNLPLRLWLKLRRSLLAPWRFAHYDLFQSTFFTRCPKPGVPEIVTVYDMIVERHRRHCGEWADQQAALKRRCLERPALVHAISQATADDVVAVCPHLAGRVRVVHPGADHLPAPGRADAADPGPDRSDGGFVLFVGDRTFYKNFPAVLDALAAADWPAGLSLTVAGRPFEPDEAADVAARGLSGRVRHVGRVPDSELARLYRRAVAFVFPSRAEGFGFPLLEAQSAGCPVVGSDIPCFRETAGDTALFFDPDSPAALAARVRELSESPRLRAGLREAGFENVRRFRWDRSAELLHQAYREAAR
jgi:glycosyltransferase involved in cell wall biosynthesis